MRNRTLAQVSDYINNCIRAIDLRMIGLKSGTEWNCVVCILRLTHRSVQQVKQEQTVLLEQLSEINSSDVKVLFTGLPVKRLESVLAELRTGYMTLDNVSFRIKSRGNGLSSERLTDMGDFNRGNADSHYRSLWIGMSAEQTPAQLLERAGIAPDTLGTTRINDLDSWMGATVFGNSVVVHLVLPMYATIEHPIDLTEGDFFARFTAHKWLFDRCSRFAVLNESWQGPPAARRPVETEVEQESDEFVRGMLKTNFRIDPAKRDASVKFQLQDKEFGLICEQQRSLHNLLSPVPNPLFTAFSQFEGGKKLRAFLLDPRGTQADKQFSAAVAWLLELLGLKVLNLSSFPEAEHLRVEGKEEGSADILVAPVASEESWVLVLDCKTTVPRPDKEAWTRVTAETVSKLSDHLFNKLHVMVRPVIVTSKPVPELLPPKRPQGDTYVLDASHLRILIDLLEKDQQGEAIGQLRSWLSLPYPLNI